MPRAPADRPSRRLDAILATLRRHGIRNFEASELEGIGKGLKWTFRPDRPARAQRMVTTPVEGPADPDLVPRNGSHPIDELDLVAQGREGPVPS